MIRSELYNGAPNEICFWVNLLSLYWLGALYLWFYPRICLIRDQSVLMLYYILFYEMTHRPYILESYIVDILFLSFSHPSIYLYTFIALQLIIRLVFLFCFCKKRFQLLQRYDLYIIYIIFWLALSLYPDNAKRWVGY